MDIINEVAKIVANYAEGISLEQGRLAAERVCDFPEGYKVENDTIYVHCAVVEGYEVSREGHCSKEYMEWLGDPDTRRYMPVSVEWLANTALYLVRKIAYGDYLDLNQKNLSNRSLHERSAELNSKDLMLLEDLYRKVIA